MNKIILMFFLIIISQMSFAQNKKNKKDTVMNLAQLSQNMTPIYFTRINSVLTFPREAISKGISSGVVYCSFSLDKYGDIYDISIIKSSNKLFNKYAVKYLEGFEAKVQPIQIGHYYSIKISFILE